MAGDLTARRSSNKLTTPKETMKCHGRSIGFAPADDFVNQVMAGPPHEPA